MATPEDLIAAAAAVRGNAHAPYSRFKVGAAILGDSGRVFVGANVENAAYPQGQCAESSAIGAMVAAGDRRIVMIAVVGGEPGGEPGDALCTPCGGCRQRIREFAAPDTAIHVGDPAGLRRSFTLDELLPQSFGPTNLAF
ncbi:cytidine deaminase [Azospirillum doebereinerae]